MQIQIITSNEDLQDIFNDMLVQAIKSIPKETKPEPIIITGEELCKKLSVTIQTLIRWKAKGKIPFIQIGSSIRYDLNNVLEALGNKKGRK